MWTKVAWLFLWMTLAFWAGCAGENQNYKATEPDRDMFDTTPPTSQDGTSYRSTRDAQTSAQPSDAEAIAAELPEADGRSVIGVDRSHWSPIVVEPASGRVPHHPHYFTREGFGVDWLLTADRPSPLYRGGDVGRSAAAVVDGSRVSFGGATWADLGLAPVKFAVDMATLPFRVVFDERPWDLTASPQD